MGRAGEERTVYQTGAPEGARITMRQKTEASTRGGYFGGGLGAAITSLNPGSAPESLSATGRAL